VSLLNSDTCWSNVESTMRSGIDFFDWVPSWGTLDAVFSLYVESWVLVGHSHSMAWEDRHLFFFFPHLFSSRKDEIWPSQLVSQLEAWELWISVYPFLPNPLASYLYRVSHEPFWCSMMIPKKLRTINWLLH
jgi:hypothetical protein